MPISIEEFSEPKFIRYQERYPLSYDKMDRFNEVNPRHLASRYPGDEGREGGWKQAGYNPNHQSTTVERIMVRSDDVALRPY